ncbi:MAG TPA: replicative DNA helicase, partial [Steroidobacter sp.]
MSGKQDVFVPPHNVEAEQAVIGGVLLEPTAYDDVADMLSVADFYRREHALIWEAFGAVVSDGSPIDLVTVESRLHSAGKLEPAGGLAYIVSLAVNTPSAANIRHYARMVKDKSIERQLMSAAMQIMDRVREDGNTREKLDYAQSLLMQISDKREIAEPVPAGDVLGAVLDEIEARYKAQGGIIGAATGFADLDEMTAGLMPADLIIVAGRPSMGKTSLAMQIAEHHADKGGGRPLVFSMEMSKNQIVLRQLAARARVDLHRIRAGKIEDQEWPRITAAFQEVQRSRIVLDDSPALSVFDVRARARRVQRKWGLSMIVVDYLQLMRGEGHSRNEEVAGISRGLKAIAKELNVPVIALSQLNRGVEWRNNKRPTMADLRDSGGIEQDADLILFLYRDEVYDPNSSMRGIAEVIVGKQRNG